MRAHYLLLFNLCFFVFLFSLRSNPKREQGEALIWRTNYEILDISRELDDFTANNAVIVVKMTSSEMYKKGDDDIDLIRPEGTRVGLPIQKFNVRQVTPASLREDLLKIYDARYDVSTPTLRKAAWVLVAKKVNKVLCDFYDVLDPLGMNSKLVPETDDVVTDSPGRPAKKARDITSILGEKVCTVI